MHSQKIYYSDDEELAAKQLECLDVLYDFNLFCSSQTGHFIKRHFAVQS
ncbi:maltose acetyltransferase domain-containing protein [Vibrio parahaemolyticus]